MMASEIRNDGVEADALGTPGRIVSPFARVQVLPGSRPAPTSGPEWRVARGESFAVQLLGGHCDLRAGDLGGLSRPAAACRRGRTGAGFADLLRLVEPGLPAADRGLDPVQLPAGGPSGCRLRAAAARPAGAGGGGQPGRSGVLQVPG